MLDTKHDRAGALLHHRPRDGGDQVERRLEVDRRASRRGAPGLSAHDERVLGCPAFATAQSMPPKLGRSSGDGAVDGRGVGDVGDDRRARASPGAPHGTRRRSLPGRHAVARRRSRRSAPSRANVDRDRLADPAAGAGDERDLPANAHAALGSPSASRSRSRPLTSPTWRRRGAFGRSLARAAQHRRRAELDDASRRFVQQPQRGLVPQNLGRQRLDQISPDVGHVAIRLRRRRSR